MKIYDFGGAPNPKKLRVYLAEKGVSVPMEQVNIMSGENRTPEFLKKNPLGGLPVLELDDGSHLTESLAIMEYFEELHPNPPLIGTTPLERARVRALERMIELGVFSRVGAIFQNTHPFMAGRIKQSADAAETARTQLAGTLKGVLPVSMHARRPRVRVTFPAISTRGGWPNANGEQWSAGTGAAESAAAADRAVARYAGEAFADAAGAVDSGNGAGTRAGGLSGRAGTRGWVRVVKGSRWGAG